jgi:hypothetical protein
MNYCRETAKMGVPPGNRWVRDVPERYVAGADTRRRQEERPYPWSQQVIHETSGLTVGGRTVSPIAVEKPKRMFVAHVR